MSGTTSGVEFSIVGGDANMRIYQGKSLSFEVVWGGAEPVDVTGYAALLQIRRIDGTLQLELSSANGKITVGGGDGRFVIEASPAETRAVTHAGLWELELTEPGGSVYRALSGTVTPAREIAV